MTIARLTPRPSAPTTAADRIKDLMLQAQQLGDEQALALSNALDEAIRLAEELDANPAAPVGQREVARQVVRDFTPVLLTLKSLRARQ